MMRRERGIYVCRVRDGRAHGGGEHQVLGRSESIGGCGGGGIKGACLVAAKRKYTRFRTRRKFEIKNTMLLHHVLLLLQEIIIVAYSQVSS
jgi:hypothetical protein